MAKKLKDYCVYCRLEIERADRAACGWEHVESRAVICPPRDATPMAEPSRTWWEFMNEKSPIIKFFAEQA